MKKMLANLAKIKLFVLGAFVLSSCAVPVATDNISQDNYHGYYKVGNPYQIDDQWYYPKEQPDYDEIGIASWYGDKFHGKKTANGDTFDKRSLTAAHNTLPLPSMVRVTNLENNKTIILMVNDRGPFAKGRVLDVSERAAEILGYKDKGIARVRVQFLEGQTKRLLADLPGEGAKVQVVHKDPATLQEWNDTQIDEQALKSAVNQADILDLKPQNESDYVKPELKVESSAPVDLMVSGKNMPEITIKSAETKVDLKPLGDAVKVESRTVIEVPLEKGEDVVLTQVDSLPDDVVVESEFKEIPEEMPESSDVEEDKQVQAMQKELEPMTPKEQKMQDMKSAEMPKAVFENFDEYYIQAGTFGNKDNVDRTERALRALGEVDVEKLMIKNRTLYRVKLGPIRDADIAKLALNKVIKMGHADAMMIINSSSN